MYVNKYTKHKKVFILTNKDQNQKMWEPSKHNDNNHCLFQPAHLHRIAMCLGLQQRMQTEPLLINIKSTYINNIYSPGSRLIHAPCQALINFFNTDQIVM